MFTRENKNRSSNVSIQIVSKAKGCYKVIKTIGSATSLRKVERLKQIVRQKIEDIEQQPALFLSDK